MTQPKTKNVVFAIIIVAYVIYAGLFIYRSSFIMNGHRAFVLLDDAMISMRYAYNLAHGYGLVWNPGGEHVEGFTNPLWVGYMAVVHLFPIDRTMTSLVIEISGAAFLLVNLFLVRAVAAELSDRHWIAELGTVILTGFYYPLNYWGILGMEVCVLTPIVTAAVYLAIRALKTERFSVALYVLLGIGTLVRLDMYAIYGGILVFMLVVDAKHRRDHLLWGIGLGVLFLGAQTAMRLAYYGDILPNTYYLKVTGVPLIPRLFQGIRAYVAFFLPLGLLGFGVLFVRWEKNLLLLCWLFAVMSAYSIYVGGDAWESQGGSNRFLSIVMPLYIVLLALTLLELSHFLQASNITRTLSYQRHVLLLGVFVYTFFSLNILTGPDAPRGGAGVDSLGYLLLLQPMKEHTYAEQQAARIVSLDQVTRPQATVAVLYAGTIPYFEDRTYVDLLGKMDKTIAHMSVSYDAMGWRGVLFMPGHMKYDPAYSVGSLAPDVVMGTWGDPSAWEPYFTNIYLRVDELGMWLRIGSPNIRWDRVH